jgi:phosphatidylglycerol:prolipoprotein diacylglycerol transferase
LIEAPGYYFSHPARIFYLWQGGFVLYGGLIFGVLGVYLFLRRTETRLGDWADLLAPCVLLGIGIGRMGCLSAGCCYGAPTDWMWGMVFTDPRGGAPLNIALHPTQLLESIFGFSAAYISHRFSLKPSQLSGSLFCFAAISYCVFRFCIEFIRGDRDRGLFFNDHISSSQLIAITVALVAVGFLVYIKRKSRAR